MQRRRRTTLQHLIIAGSWRGIYLVKEIRAKIDSCKELKRSKPGATEGKNYIATIDSCRKLESNKPGKNVCDEGDG